uniref:Putative secreted salivary protein n=1 Tax=Rhipicephalus sanguineus TaxID=34632 RepID=C9W1R5_RHISA
MNNFTACFIVMTFLFMSADWQPSGNVRVGAGRIITGAKDCWRHSCDDDSCYTNGCECPSVFLRIFGLKNCS